ncbi:lantibiotic dehydratase [Pedobacter sp. Hv1]|uniref:lantibiotic dehydratase n=1 Tax=Pedobacter sp. Hv1 TaxID=1740090 RepID=UPI0013793940|nr:lantibiotic dehydratase [Pedobacter sp. Hv1]
MKITPFQLIICRTPAFPIENTLTSVWEELKEKIKTSSPIFYALIADKKVNEIELLPQKIQFTIWKYFNRARYRATPFGSFASFSTFPLHNDVTEPAQLQSLMMEHTFTDWSEKDSDVDVKDSLNHATFILSNSTVYEVGNEIRYISFKDGQFQLSSVISFDELKTILKICTTKTSIVDLCAYLKTEFQINETSSKDLLRQLIALQLISTDLFPNITGEDYFKRIKANQRDKSIDYILSERKIQGYFDQKKLQQIPELINCLRNIKSSPISNNLREFKLAFIKKYEQRHIPLAMAMDPELGIGYGNLEQQYHANDLIEILKAAKINSNFKNQFEYTKLHRLLLNKIIKGEEIDLQNFEQQQLHLPHPLPNTFSLIFHLYQDNVVMESLGGCTANSLLGRFTLANDELGAYGKEIADLENEVNPTVLFFDIAYQAEKNIDNVNRRNHIYTHELPILSWSTSANPIELNDIMIGIKSDEIILSSKKLGKRLVPRISSAYNYSRSDLAVYRFLCDLQHQGIQSNLQFTLNEYFPGLEHYPRVYFKHIIVAPAQWLVPSVYCKPKKEESVEETIQQFKKWLVLQKISLPFKAGNGDQTLTFHPDQDEDLLAFLNYSRQQNGADLYITEALIAPVDFLKDENGNGYAPQYIVNYYHKERIYAPLEELNHAAQNFRKPTDIKLPGSDWLYFEIYCHPYTSNTLLLQQIQTFIKNYRFLLEQWFFIRYDDPSPHIRLRLKVKNTDSIAILLPSFKNLFEPFLLSETVKDIELKTYYRETKRYGSTRIDLVEHFFYLDSKLVINILKNAKTIEELYIYGLQTMQFFCNCYTNSIDQQIDFVKKVAANFAEEMKMDIEIFKKLNLNFATFKNNNEISKVLAVPYVSSRQKVLHKIMAKCIAINEPETMLADLIHMHVNRLFASDQRKHETILYHYLLKLLQTKRARLKQL